MKVKMILPALDRGAQPLLPPDQVLRSSRRSGWPRSPATSTRTTRSTLQDEHVETLDLDDEPDLVVIQVYITSAYRAYALADHYRARGAYVALGGLHVTSLPDEARAHADTHLPRPRRGHLAGRSWPTSAAGRPRRSTTRRVAHAGRAAAASAAT